MEYAGDTRIYRRDISVRHSEGIDAPLFQAAEKWPERPAFRCRGEVLTYTELLARAECLAACLIDEGVSKGDRVGIAMTKGLEMPIAVYGIWLAGAVFVPMDTNAPVARHAAIIEDCELRVLVGSERNKPLLQNLAQTADVTIVGVEIDGVRCRMPAASAPDFEPVANGLDDLAYIIFTSGSTGVPKGIVHTHRSGRAFAKAWYDKHGLTKDDVFFCTVPLHFDFSLADFFTPPMAGATTELVPEPTLMFPASLAAAIQESGATIWSTVPYPIIQIVERGGSDQFDLSSLRWLIYGGEPMPSAKLAGINQTFSAKLSNSYGPAEVNQVTQYTVPHDHPADSPIPIGEPMNHTEIVLSEDGELLFAGEMMMQGYWRRPELNAKIFVEQDGKRFYRSGDLGSQRDDGLWMFHGRIDRQVKIRGNRVELDEIEATLAAHPAVSEAGVVPTADKMALNAFVTLVPGDVVDPNELMAHCRSQLPGYAVPASVTVRDAFVRTGTGKIDRRALESEET